MGRVSELPGIGKVLIAFGLAAIAIGIGLTLMPKIPWLGRLPGDIMIKKEGFVFYFPLASCLIISLVISLILRIFRH